jgi:hypothetical protein
MPRSSRTMPSHWFGLNTGSVCTGAV